MVPSRATFCSLNTARYLSPALFTPFTVKLAGGLDGIFSSLVGLPSASLARASSPLVMVVEPDVPDLDAVHVLLTASATKGPVLRVFTDAVLVTDVFPL